MIETERLILRPWKDTDRAPFAALNADPRVMEFFKSTFPPEISNQGVDKLIAHQNEHGFCFFATERKDTKEFIGFIGIQHVPWEAHFTPAVEIGWRLACEHWGNGFATEGAKACIDYGLNTLKLPEIVSFTAELNKRSENVMIKIGMQNDPADNFDHPNIASDHPLCKHVLYRITPGM